MIQKFFCVANCVAQRVKLRSKKLALNSFSVFLGCSFKFLGEDTVEITFIFISDRYGNFFNCEGSVSKQECRLRKTFFLQVLGVGFARAVLNLVAEPIEIVVQKLCRIGKTTVLVIFLNIAENIHYRLILAAFV